MAQAGKTTHIELEFLDAETQTATRSWVDVEAVDFGARPYILKGFFHDVQEHRSLPIRRIHAIRESGSGALDPIDFLDRLVLDRPELAKRSPHRSAPEAVGEVLDRPDSNIWLTLLAATLVLSAIAFGLTR